MNDILCPLAGINKSHDLPVYYPTPHDHSQQVNKRSRKHDSWVAGRYDLSLRIDAHTGPQYLRTKKKERSKLF
jgi:hypothetical protein